MPFEFPYYVSTKKGLTQYVVRFRIAGHWGVKVFSKRNCGSDTNAQKKAYAYYSLMRARRVSLEDVVLKPQILQN